MEQSWYRVGGTKERGPSHGPFLFPRFSPSLRSRPLSLSSSVRLSALCSLAHSLAHSLARSRTTRGVNRIRNKTNPISRNARGPTRGSDLHAQTGSRSFHFSLRVLFLLSPSRRPGRLSLNVSRCFSLRLSRNLSFPEIFTVPLVRSGETRVKGTRKAGMTKPASCCEKGASTIVVDVRSAGRGQLERSGKERGKEKG